MENLRRTKELEQKHECLLVTEVVNVKCNASRLRMFAFARQPPTYRRLDMLHLRRRPVNYPSVPRRSVMTGFLNLLTQSHTSPRTVAGHRQRAPWVIDEGVAGAEVAANIVRCRH